MRARLLVLIVTLSACPAVAPPASTALNVQALPDAPLTALDGRRVGLTESLGGRVALVSLWATWCEACLHELDALNRLHDRAAAQGGLVLAVSVGEKPARVADFARERRLRYAMLVDEDFSFSDRLGRRRVPTTLVVDARGRVLYSGGELDGAALAAFRQALGLTDGSARRTVDKP